MWAARNQHRHEKDESRATHLVTVAKRINSTMQPIGFDGHPEIGCQDQKKCEGVRRYPSHRPIIQQRRGNNSESSAKPSLPSCSLRFGVLWPLALHLPALRFPAVSNCLAPRPPASGSLIMAVASFAMVVWVMARRLA